MAGPRGNTSCRCLLSRLAVVGPKRGASCRCLLSRLVAGEAGGSAGCRCHGAACPAAGALHWSARPWDHCNCTLVSTCHGHRVREGRPGSSRATTERCSPMHRDLCTWWRAGALVETLSWAGPQGPAVAQAAPSAASCPAGHATTLSVAAAKTPARHSRTWRAAGMKVGEAPRSGAVGRLCFGAREAVNCRSRGVEMCWDAGRTKRAHRQEGCAF